MKTLKADSIRSSVLSILLLVVCATWAVPAQGQEGHPLAGSWHGAWGSGSEAGRNDLTVIMDWDGEEVTGLANPVTDRSPLRNARLDSSDWTVRFEVDLADGSGDRMSCRADGRLDNLGSDRRTLAGTWICGDVETRFELTRDRDY